MHSVEERNVKNMRHLMIALFLVGSLTACATAKHAAVAPPLRDADLYPVNQQVAGLTIAVDEIADTERARRYFGSDLTQEGILPVNLIFSNHGDDHFAVRPSDILLTDGNRVVDVIPGLREGGGTQLQETVVPPGGNYQGFVFFTLKKQPGLYGKVEKLFSGNLQLRMVVRDKDTGERLLFGPYSLSGF